MRYRNCILVVAVLGICRRTTWVGLLCLMAAALMSACDDDLPPSTTPLPTDTPLVTPTNAITATPTATDTPILTPVLAATPTGTVSSYDNPTTIPTPTAPPTTAYDANGENLTERPLAESEADPPAGLLSRLPADSVHFIFVEADLVLQRPAMREEVESVFEILAGRTFGVISAELLVAAGIKSAAFGTTANEYLGAAIVLGSFDGFLEVLREAPSLAETNSRFDPPGVLDPHRGVELFVFPWYDDLFIAVPDSDTLLLAESPELLKEIIDRHLDGGELDASLARLLGHTDGVDFLVAFSLEAEGDGQGDGSSPPPPTFYAHAGFLNEGETSTVYAYMEFAEDAINFVSEQPDLSDLFFRYNSDTVKPVGELWQDGRAVIAKAVVPDKDVYDLFLTD